MIKMMAASRRRPGLTRSDYQRYIEFCHGGLARFNRMGLQSYIQNHVIDSAFGTLDDKTYNQIANRDGVVDLCFNNFQDLISTLEPAEPSEASDDGKFFADEPNSITVMAEEEEIPVSNPLPTFNPGPGLIPKVGGLKIMQYIMRDPNVFPEDYYKYWREAHEAALEKAPYAKTQLRRCVLNKRSRLNENDTASRAHFKIVDPLIYDMVVCHWYDTIELAGAFREYNEALMAYGKKFADWSKSFFLYTKQIVIIRDTPYANDVQK